VVGGPRQWSEAELNELTPLFVKTDVKRRCVLHFLWVFESLLFMLLCDALDFYFWGTPRDSRQGRTPYRLSTHLDSHQGEEHGLTLSSHYGRVPIFQGAP